MKTSLFWSASLFASAFAFPASLLNKDISDDQLAEITALAAKVKAEIQSNETRGNVKRLGFNADAQRVDTTGQWEYRAPGPNDIRGPCPGLNAMANHGYLDRNGISSAVKLATASNQVFGMGIDLAAFLGVYASVMAGDITSCSIGGPPGNGGLLGGLGLVGKPQGLSNSHNRFEADASPMRADLYSTGNPVGLNLDQFEKLAAKPLGPNGYDLSVLVPFRVERIQNSIATNGHYYAGPFTHIVVNAATFFFTYRYFANHTAEHPEGYLDLETLKSFEGVTGEPGSFEWSRGRERIPENWYRRAIGDEYGILQFDVDATAALLAHPDLIRVGGNTGEPNSFVGVDIDNLTGGVFNAEKLLEGNNAVCFAFLATSQATPDILKGLLGNVVEAVSKLTDALDPILQTLGCPQLAKYDATLLQKFPGAGSGL